MLETPQMPKQRWLGETVVCIASGPSLIQEDLSFVASRRSAGLCKAIVVNREFEFAPWADVLYAADYRFWMEYIEDVRKGFSGECWTVDQEAAKRYKLNFIRRGTGEGYETNDTLLNTGGNSGYQAIHLAAHFGAKKIVMLGYDLQNTNGKPHHFGVHRNGLPSPTGFRFWVPRFKKLFVDLKNLKIEVVNSTRVTAIPEGWVRRAPIEEAL